MTIAVSDILDSLIRSFVRIKVSPWSRCARFTSTYRPGHIQDKQSRHTKENMNTIAILTLCLLAAAVSAQRRGGDPENLIGYSPCPRQFCYNGQCGLFEAFSYNRGRQCTCPCSGSGGGSGGSRIRDCPRYFCRNGQCGRYNSYSSYNYQRCRCNCYGYSGYSGRIQN